MAEGWHAFTWITRIWVRKWFVQARLGPIGGKKALDPMPKSKLLRSSSAWACFTVVKRSIQKTSDGVMALVTVPDHQGFKS